MTRPTLFSDRYGGCSSQPKTLVAAPQPRTGSSHGDGSFFAYHSDDPPIIIIRRQNFTLPFDLAELPQQVIPQGHGPPWMSVSPLNVAPWKKPPSSRYERIRWLCGPAHARACARSPSGNLREPFLFLRSHAGMAGHDSGDTDFHQGPQTKAPAGRCQLHRARSSEDEARRYTLWNSLLLHRRSYRHETLSFTIADSLHAAGGGACFRRPSGC